MPPIIRAAGFESDGIGLLSPDEASFDSTIRGLFRGNADELLRLKPFLTVVTNQSDRTVVAYCVKWRLTPTHGVEVTHSHYKYPDAVAGYAPSRGNEIHPGEQKIVAMGIEIDCGRWGGVATEDFYLSQFVEWFREYSEMTQLEIGLDAVIFKDGELIGADESGLADDFTGYVDAKQSFYRSIVEALDAGRSMDEAFHPVDAAMAAMRANLGRLDGPDSRWPNAAPEVRAWRRKYGDRALPEILRRALRSEPFAVHRRVIS